MVQSSCDGGLAITHWTSITSVATLTALVELMGGRMINMSPRYRPDNQSLGPDGGREERSLAKTRSRPKNLTSTCRGGAG